MRQPFSLRPPYLFTLATFGVLAIMLAGGSVLFHARIDSPMVERTGCADNLRVFGRALVEDRETTGWPDFSGSAFLLQLYLKQGEVRQGRGKVLLCEHAVDSESGTEPGSDRHRAMFANLTEASLRAGEWPDGITSYAGRNMRDHPLTEDSDDPEIIASAACPHHRDGVAVLYADGSTEFLTWDDLGIDSAEEFGFRYGRKGIGGPGPLEVLCIRLE